MGVVPTTEDSDNPITTLRSLPEVETSRHRTVETCCPSSSVTRGVTGQEVGFVVCRGVSLVFGPSVGG